MIITHIVACLIIILFFFLLRSTLTTFVQLPKTTWFVVRLDRNQWPARWQRDSLDRFSAWELFTTCPQQRAAHSSLAITSQTSSHGAGESDDVVIYWFVRVHLSSSTMIIEENSLPITRLLVFFNNSLKPAQREARQRAQKKTATSWNFSWQKVGD